MLLAEKYVKWHLHIKNFNSDISRFGFSTTRASELFLFKIANLSAFNQTDGNKPIFKEGFVTLILIPDVSCTIFSI